LQSQVRKRQLTPNRVFTFGTGNFLSHDLCARLRHGLTSCVWNLCAYLCTIRKPGQNLDCVVDRQLRFIHIDLSRQLDVTVAKQLHGKALLLSRFAGETSPRCTAARENRHTYLIRLGRQFQWSCNRAEVVWQPGHALGKPNLWPSTHLDDALSKLRRFQGPTEPVPPFYSWRR